MELRVLLFAVATGLAVIVHLGLGIPLGLSFLIFFVGWPVMGTLVTLDDDFAGSWSNPDGSWAGRAQEVFV